MASPIPTTRETYRLAYRYIDILGNVRDPQAFANTLEARYASYRPRLPIDQCSRTAQFDPHEHGPILDVDFIDTPTLHEDRAERG